MSVRDEPLDLATVDRRTTAALAVLLGTSRENVDAMVRGARYLRGLQQIGTHGLRIDGLCLPWAIREPREAWEALSTHDVIPRDWVENPLRRFYDRDLDCCHCGETYARHDHEHGFVSYNPDGAYAPSPPTMEQVVAFASEPQALLTVEALARECLRSQWPWTRAQYGDHPTRPAPESPPSVVVWRVESANYLLDHVSPETEPKRTIWEHGYMLTGCEADRFFMDVTSQHLQALTRVGSP